MVVVVVVVVVCGSKKAAPNVLTCEYHMDFTGTTIRRVSLKCAGAKKCRARTRKLFECISNRMFTFNAGMNKKTIHNRIYRE